MKYDHLKKRVGVAKVINHLSVISSIFKNYKIQTNVTDKNTKFSTKCVHCNHGSCEIFIYMKYLYVKFTCLWQAHILFTVLKPSEFTVLYDSVSHE